MTSSKADKDEGCALVMLTPSDLPVGYQEMLPSGYFGTASSARPHNVIMSTCSAAYASIRRQLEMQSELNRKYSTPYAPDPESAGKLASADVTPDL